MAGRGQRASKELDGRYSRSATNTVRREQVSEIQRLRLLAAMAEVCAEFGAGNATVAQIVERSGVSRRTFYEQFVDREDCFLAAFDQTVERIARVVLPAYRQPARWHERIRAGLTALLQFLESERRAGQLVVVAALGAGPKALERRRRVLAQMVSAVEEGRGEGNGSGADPPPLTDEGLVGGALSIIHARLVGDEDGSLVELVNPLMSMIVLPYLGATLARSELDRTIAGTHRGTARTSVDPLRNLDMRLTYRTVRVLLAAGAHPGASNRQVADAAGIRDQGQVSKLLARLRRLGLVENVGAERANGRPNVWMLTERGAEVRRGISP
jgi:AcrR family transcriptional regulator/DNA-binding MarR family transcriptional regulator